MSVLSSLHEAEIGAILSFQQLGDFVQVMRTISSLGWEAIPIMLTLVYLGVSPRVGARLCWLYLLSCWISEATKLGFHSPRPYWIDGRVEAFATAGNYGLPSGHVVVAASAWLFLALSYRRRWLWWVAIIVIVLVSISRVYLGAHFISDVVGAWVFGGAAIGLFLWIEAKTKAILTPLTPLGQITITMAVSAWLVLTGVALGSAFSGANAVSQWAVYASGEGNFSELIRLSSIGLGLGISLVMAKRWLNFDASSSIWKRILCVLYALAGLELLAMSFELLPADMFLGLGRLSSYVRPALETWWVVFIAPWLLLNMGLAKSLIETTENLGKHATNSAA